MQLTKFINGFSYILGTTFVLASLLNLLTATTATFHPEPGKYFAYVNVGIFALLGLMFFLAPHTKRYAKFILVFLLLSLAVTFIWLVFSQKLDTNNPVIYQAGAVAFAVLLIARISSWLRTGRSQNDT
jgi:membrane associated rhomboid family serine protease